MSHVQRVASSTRNIPSEVIYNGVDTDLFSHKLPVPYKKGDPQMLFVGNLYRHKNVIGLIEMMSRIINEFPNAHLQIIGSGDDYISVKQIVNKHGMNDRVEIIGNVSDKELALRYSSSDVYVSASMNEDFGLPLLEAMACGKPVLVSNIPSHLELVSASGAGQTFSLEDDDMLAGLKSIMDRSAHYSANAIEFARKNDWSKVCERVLTVYEKERSATK